MTQQAGHKRRHKAIRIVIFNHKGGVGKTTLAVNIAAALVESHKTVLLVDSDPQCNLTSYLVDDEVVDELLDTSDDENGKTLWSAVKPVRDGEGRARAIPAIPRLGSSRLALLPGDIRLATFENELGEAWGECFQRRPRGYKMMSALSEVVNLTASAIDADFVFYDAGPNIGPLNRAIVLDCEFLVVPASCDLFSARAMKTLGQSVASWIKDWRTVQMIAPDDAMLLPGRPRIMGYIPQRFRVYGGQISTTQARFLGRIEKQLHADVLQVIRGLDPELAPLSVAQLKLGQVKEFGRLAPASQRDGVPIWQVDGATPAEQAQARSTFMGIAAKLIERAEAYP